ncbi:MAG: nucleotidyltransferase domain-containing protein [Blastocatellia bacterium]
MRAPRTPAVSLLLNAARLASDNGEAERILTLPEFEARFEWRDGSAWDSLLALAALHGMRPLLYRHLSVVFAAIVPSLKLAELQEFVRQNLLKNLRMTGELIVLLRLFAEYGVNVMPFKGPTLAALAYDDLGLREFGDLDLLIAKRDLMLAQELMLAQGYQPEIMLNVAQSTIFADACNVLAFTHSGKEITVELHWELSPRYLPFSPDPDQLRRRMVPSWPGGQKVMTLSPEDLLVYLCAHGAKHAWERLIWIADVAGLIHRHPSLDWDRVCGQAAGQRSERSLFLGLRLARDLTGVSLPLEVEEFMRSDPESERLAMKVAEWLFPASGSTRSLAAQSLFILRLQQRWPDKIRSFIRLVTTPSVADWNSTTVPGQFAPLYPLLRPLRLLKRLVSGSR